jgi:hypothetical protein
VPLAEAPMRVLEHALGVRTTEVGDGASLLDMRRTSGWGGAI